MNFFFLIIIINICTVVFYYYQIKIYYYFIIIYNTTTGRTGLAAGAAIAVIDFGGTKTSTNGDFTVEFPPSGGGSPDSTNAIIRIA